MLPYHYEIFRKISLFTFVIALGLLVAGKAWAEDNEDLNVSVLQALKECQQVSSTCAQITKSAPGVLVFPKVLKADLIFGGAGGKGALIENGNITGYYYIGAASAGFQAGIGTSSHVYAFRTKEGLQRLKDGSEWKIGTGADVVVVQADTNMRAASGDVFAFVFDAEGLHAGVALDVFNVWKSGQRRPS